LGPILSNAKRVNEAIVKAADRGDMQGMLNVIAANISDFNCVNLSTALHKLARLCQDGVIAGASDHRFRMLHKRTEWELSRQISEASHGEVLPRCWSTIAWAYGKIQAQGVQITNIFASLSQLSLPHLSMFRPFELTNLIWGFAKVQVPNVLLFKAAQQRMLNDAGSFSAANLSTVAWACVTARRWEGQAVKCIAGEFARQLSRDEVHQQVSPVEISNMMWSLAMAGVRTEHAVFQVVGNAALQMLPDFKVQELSITAWAFSRLEVRHDAFFIGASRMVKNSSRIQQHIHPQGVANLLWAFEKQKVLGGNAPELLSVALSLLPASRRLLSQLKPQEYTSVVCASSRFDLQRGAHPDADELFEQAAVHGHQLLEHLSQMQITNLLEAFTRFTRGCIADQPFAGFIAALVQASLSTAVVPNRSADAHVNPDGVLYQGSVPNRSVDASLSSEGAAYHRFVPGRRETAFPSRGAPRCHEMASMSREPSGCHFLQPGGHQAEPCGGLADGPDMGYFQRDNPYEVGGRMSLRGMRPESPAGRTLTGSRHCGKACPDMGYFQRDNTYEDYDRHELHQAAAAKYYSDPANRYHRESAQAPRAGLHSADPMSEVRRHSPDVDDSFGWHEQAVRLDYPQNLPDPRNLFRQRGRWKGKGDASTSHHLDERRFYSQQLSQPATFHNVDQARFHSDGLVQPRNDYPPSVFDNVASELGQDHGAHSLYH
jgi:hypothetical protein